MLSRRLTQVVLVCLALSLSALAQVNQGTGFLLHLTGAGSGGTRLVGYLANANDLNPDLDTSGPTNANQILATPNGQRFYLVSDGPLQAIDAQLQNFTTLNSITGPFKRVMLTPDGKYLLVAGSSFFIVDTATNAVVATNLGVSGEVVDFAVSPDSKKAWILQQFSFTGAVTPINLSNLTAGTRVDLPRSGANITLSPLGRLYITSGNGIAEYDPDTLALAANIEVLATPGPLRFTPDGTRAYFVNRTPNIGGRSILSFRTQQRDVVDWPPFNPLITPPTFEDVYVVGNDRIFAFDKGAHTLYEITQSPFGGQVANLNSTFPGDRVYAVAFSDEIPSARFLYVLTESGNQGAIKRIALSNGSVSAESITSLTSGTLRYVSVPPQSGAAQFIKINDNQLLAQGGAGKPLGLYITDGLGRPVFNTVVTFSAEGNSGVTIGNATPTTNSSGYVSTPISVPVTPGIYTINVSAGTANTTFTITVPGAGGGIPGQQRISVYRGNGQVLSEGGRTSLYTPLTARVVDEDGDPQANVEVIFSVIDGPGSVGNLQAVTDEEGLISAQFESHQVAFGRNFQSSTVRAESPYGTTDFVVTTVSLDPRNQSGAPQTIVVKPTFQQVNVGRGDIIKDFFVVETKATRFPQIGEPIPNIGLRVGDAVDSYIDGPGSCVNNTLGDNLGVSRCDFQLSCDAQGTTQIQMIIGEFRAYPMLLTIGPGSGSALSYVSGNGQTGTAGQQLTNLLTARVTDNCGNGVPGRNVNWSIVSGSATLSQVVNTSGADGRVTARVTLGANPGPVQVRVTMEGVAPVVFNLTNQVIVSSIGLVSGGGQTAAIGAQFANPVTFVVRDSSNNPVGAGLNVNFSVSGAGSINPVQATTDSQGRVQTTVTAGNAAGSVSVTASYLGFTSTANLTVLPAGINLTTSLFRNAASDAVGLVPCGLVTVVAPGLAPNVNGVVSGVSPFGPLAFSLAGVDEIRVNGVLAPIQAVSNQNGKQQINFQVPCETQPGTATVAIRVSGQTSSVSGVPVFAGQPGIFTYAGPSGKQYAAVIRLKDGSYVQPSNPAVTGENYWVIVTGMGQTTPALTTNSPGIPNQSQNVNLQTIVGVANGGVPSQPAKYLPGAIGVYYVEFTMSPDVLKGAQSAIDVPFAVAVVINGQASFGNPVLLPAIVRGQ